MPPAAVLEAAVDLPSSAESVEITPRVSTPIEPEKLHPALWLGHQLGRQVDVAWSTGFAELDAELPGHGWPRRAITEVLLPHPGIGEMRLFAPALRVAQADRIVMLFDPPLDPSASAVAALGIDTEQLLIVHHRGRNRSGGQSDVGAGTSAEEWACRRHPGLAP